MQNSLSKEMFQNQPNSGLHKLLARNYKKMLICVLTITVWLKQTNKISIPILSIMLILKKICYKNIKCIAVHFEREIY